MNEIAKLLRQAYSLLVESEIETDSDALGLIIEEAQGCVAEALALADERIIQGRD